MSASNPHDTFLKKLLAEPSYAVELFRTMLPPNIVERLDWKSLRQTPDHFVDARLREFFSDALFFIERKKENTSCGGPTSKQKSDSTNEKETGREAETRQLPSTLAPEGKAHDIASKKIATRQAGKGDASARRKALSTNKDSVGLYLLFEHKSSPGKGIHLQLLRYLVRIYEKMDTPLVPVIPIVFYHGKKDWSIPAAFIETFFLDSTEKGLFNKYLPDFSYELYDLSREELDQARLSIELRAILDVLKNIWYFNEDSEIRRWVEDAASFLQAWYEGRGGEQKERSRQKKVLELLLVYVYSCIEIEPERLKEVFSSVRPEYGEIAMTTAEMLIEKGIEKGIEQGIEQGIEKGTFVKALEAARRMQEKDYLLADIVEITGLSEETLREHGVRKTDD